jgi:sugar phosphate isomerase/epimerase
MFKPAFSTVACPEWTLAALAGRLEDLGFMGCELRTFGSGSRGFACDPALTAPAKTRSLFANAGVSICSLATGVRFDHAVTPPVIGNVISDTQRSLREAKSAVDLAVQLEVPLVRVFGFEFPEGEPRKRGLARVVERLALAADHCRTSGVRLMVENGGSFSTAVQLAELLDAVDNPLVVAAYSPAVAMASGEKPEAGLNVLRGRTACVKLKDMQAGVPVELGRGDLRCKEICEQLAKIGYDGWVVYEFDRAWLAMHAAQGHAVPHHDTHAAEVLSASAKTLFSWRGGSPAPKPNVRTGRIVG